MGYYCKISIMKVDCNIIRLSGRSRPSSILIENIFSLFTLKDKNKQKVRGLYLIFYKNSVGV